MQHDQLVDRITCHVLSMTGKAKALLTVLEVDKECLMPTYCKRHSKQTAKQTQLGVLLLHMQVMIDALKSQRQPVPLYTEVLHKASPKG